MNVTDDVTQHQAEETDCFISAIIYIKRAWSKVRRPNRCAAKTPPAVWLRKTYWRGNRARKRYCQLLSLSGDPLCPSRRRTNQGQDEGQGQRMERRIPRCPIAPLTAKHSYVSYHSGLLLSHRSCFETVDFSISENVCKHWNRRKINTWKCQQHEIRQTKQKRQKVCKLRGCDGRQLLLIKVTSGGDGFFPPPINRITLSYSQSATGQNPSRNQMMSPTSCELGPSRVLDLTVSRDVTAFWRRSL